ncbi:SPOSA6832_01176 [Sporobolomyces salmonicolor]|uniref:chitin synthase n=1 Tax=Sporidiobolus salmonicolor TaxID=5005 RepID=A0A0D6EI68_SPOSA|nr:SPOSA6832_01176 [Sporobolomyces salmonicolor]
MSGYPPHNLDPFHDRHSPNSAAHSRAASPNPPSARNHSPYGGQTAPHLGYPLQDSYAGSTQTLPSGSSYSLAGGAAQGDPGEEKFYSDEGYHDESDKVPLREEFAGQPQLGYDPDQPLYNAAGFAPQPGAGSYSSYGPSSGGYGGSRTLTRKETSAEAWKQRQKINPRRALTKKVKLTNGNYIAEFPVPTAVKNANLSSNPRGGPTEFSHMRYTAATCDPNDFTPEIDPLLHRMDAHELPNYIQNGYSLRASSYGRETDLLVCITAYNENKILLARTLHGLMLNIRDMVKGKFSEFRRKAEAGGAEGGRTGEAWKRIVVCLVFDGIEPADKNSLEYVEAFSLLSCRVPRVIEVRPETDPHTTRDDSVLATIGLYQDGVMQKSVDGKETVAHIFEYTTQLSMSPKPALVEPHPNDPNNLVPVQFIFCLKQKNAKKINSHRWLFNAIGKHLQPDVVCLLDAGTKPGKRSIYYLWEAFHHDRHLGGAAGEIHAMLGKGGRKLLNPLVAAQNFEYKARFPPRRLAVSNVLDKPTESAFGYVVRPPALPPVLPERQTHSLLHPQQAVLPGAFSCYRYSAIQGRPLNQYFHGDQTLAARLGPKGTDGMSIWTKNMFLAEDRILCFELVAKANERWVLGYVKPAKGETDVPETAAELIGQRRRWLNGSFAAGVYSLVHFGRYYKSNHGIIRLFFLHVQAIYNTINLIMSWFSVGNYYLTFSIIISMVGESLRSPNDIAGGDPATIKCWSGSFIEDNSGTSFDWLALVNWLFKVIYLIFLALQVILALGNRPKAERLTYTASFLVFAFFALYLIFMTVILTIKAFCPIQSLLDSSSGSSIGVFLGSTYGPIFAGIAGTFGSSIFERSSLGRAAETDRLIVLPLAGVYIISAFLYLDPWHLFHSMPMFLLVAPSFTNILNVYAFCNLHDVSWGTKGSDKVEALPAAQSKKDGAEKIVETQERVQEDIDYSFKATVLRAVEPFEEEAEIDRPTMDDRNKTFRTRFICVWLLMNATLALAITKLGQTTRSRYFQAILWITFGLSLVRLLGMIWYLTGESFFRLARLCSRGRK